MDLSDLLKPAAVIPSLRVQNKRQTLEEMSARASELTGLAERDIFDTVLKRERLGSTGVGHGVAIPHGRMRGIDHIVGVFARLPRPIDFEALDEEPVDLVFLLLAPDNAGADHLKALARIARILRDPNMSARLRGAVDAETLHTLIVGPDDAASTAAA